MTKTTGNFTDFVTFSRASGGTYLDSDGLIKTAATNVPRIEYDASGNLKGLLIEEARTNLLPYSNDFTDASWTKTRSSISSGEELAPDGNTATKLVEDTSLASSHTLIYVYSGAPVATYTNSIFVKAAGRTYVRIAQPVTESFYADFSLSDGSYTAAPSTTASSQYFGDGWYRLSITYTTTSIHSLAFAVYLSVGTSITYNGDGTSGVYLYGAQHEAGAFPTSYIPTTGNPLGATRAADICSMPVSAFGYNQKAGTIVVDVDSRGSSGSHIVNINDGTTSNRMALYGNLNIYVTSGGVNSVNSPIGSPTVQDFSAAFAYKQNDCAGSLSGASAVSDTSATIPTTVSTVRIGADQGGTNVVSGHIKSIQYFPRRLTNAQLQALTA